MQAKLSYQQLSLLLRMSCLFRPDTRSKILVPFYNSICYGEGGPLSCLPFRLLCSTVDSPTDGRCFAARDASPDPLRRLLSWGWPGACACQGLSFCSLYLGLDLSLHVNCTMSTVCRCWQKKTRSFDFCYQTLLFILRLVVGHLQTVGDLAYF